MRGHLAVAAAGIAALALPAPGRAYEWPLKPFDAQHAIRGSFDDPRIHVAPGRTETASFHFGVDIPAPGGTPVYAVAPGTVYRYPDAIAVRRPDGHEFSYWHVTPAVAEHSSVQTHELIGWVRPDWGHVHFAESDGGGYLNPLRPGALEPYVDTTAPVVADVDPFGDGLIAEVYDRPPIAPPPPWQGAVLTPALVRWRVEGVTSWRTAADFRGPLLPPWLFDDVYAPGTRQNKPERPGRYVIWLAHRLELPPGRYRVEVEAFDLAGNRGVGSAQISLQSRSSR